MKYPTPELRAPSLLLRLLSLVWFTAATAPSFAATHNVDSISELNAAIAIVQPGDVIIMANGSYTTTAEISVNKAGTSTQSITIRAASVGGVTISGSAGFHLKSPAAYVVIQGFKFRHSGTLVMDLGTHHCRISRNDFDVGGSNYLWVQGLDHEIDFNLFQNKTSSGQMVKVDLSGRGHSGTQRPFFHHNHFLNHNGTGEAISTWGGFTRMESNLFTECNGDPEVISAKASDGIYINNTFRSCNGGLVLRFANRCTLDGNFMIDCNPGMRVYGADHKIFNNCIQSSTTGILVGNGNSDGTYLQSLRIQMVHNTLVNNGKGVGATGADLPPKDIVFANNIIRQSSGTFFDMGSAWQTSTLQGNIMHGGGAQGDMPSSGYRAVDPLLVADGAGIFHIQSGSPAIDTPVGTYTFVTLDQDGQPRGTRDVGADEFSSAPVTRRALTASDVGPNASSPTDPLPPPWSNNDIGSVGVAGNAGFSGGVFTVNGSGADIWSTADAFHYVHQAASGDLTITARVATQEPTHAWAKSGVMVRESTAAGSAHAAIYVSASNGVSMQVRPATGAASINLATVAGFAAPHWVRLVRSGNTFTGFRSADGTSWTQVATTNITMFASARAGLAVTSHDNAVLATAAFDNVSLTTPAPDFSIAAAPGSRTVTAGNGTTYTATITAGNGFSGTVTFSASGLPAGAGESFSPVSVTGSGSSTMTITTSASTPTGTHLITITGTSGSLVHSVMVSLVVQPPPTDFTLSVTPSSQTINAGGADVAYTVNSTALNFSSAVTLSVSGLPAGASATFSPNPITPPQSSTLTVSAAGATTGGTYPLTITGAGGGLTRTANATLVVNGAQPPTILQEAELLSRTSSGPPINVVADTLASNGQWVSLLSSNVGQFIEYTVTNIPAGTWGVGLLYKQHNNRGIHNLTVDGVQLDGTLNQFGSVVFLEKDFGGITFATAGNHTVRLTVTGKDAASGNHNLSADAFRLTATNEVWLSQDIGAVGIAGSFNQNGSQFTIAGSGADIWSTADQFRYAYQNMSGDFDIVAKVVSEQQTHGFAKAGVMIRQSLATNSVNAAVLLTPTNGVALQIRPTTGAASVNVTGWVKGPVPPHWVRLARSGNTFTAFHSPDGSTWTQLGSTNVTMTPGVTAGMAVTSHNNAALNTAVFE